MNKASFIFPKAIFFTAITTLVFNVVFNTAVADEKSNIRNADYTDFSIDSSVLDSSALDNPRTDSEIPTYFIGYAYDIDSQKLVYSEHHQYVTPTLHKVEYREPSGEVFATKTIDYSHSFFAPNFTQHNLRNGEKITIYRKNPMSEKIKYHLKYQENTKNEPENEIIKYRPRLIIDAGFDHFITKNWDALLSKKSRTIDYLIPSAFDHYELTVKENTCTNTTSNPNVPSTSNESIHCFSISASSFFIGLFSSQLGLTYAKNNTSEIIRLIEFRGRSNISDQDGNYQNVKINYTYF